MGNTRKYVGTKKALFRKRNAKKMIVKIKLKKMSEVRYASPPRLEPEVVDSIRSEFIDMSPNRSREDYTISNVTEEDGNGEIIIGRRILNVSFFMKQLVSISTHGPLQCGLVSSEIVSESRVGLISKIKMKCKMCGMCFIINSDEGENTMNVNTSAVAGSIAIGCGQSQLSQLTATLGLPTITKPLFNRNMQLVNDIWEREALSSMNEAAEEERLSAIAEGKVNKDGIPIIDVIADGCWGKRSYQKNYNSLSGAAAIVGKKTNKILFMAVKNKYCAVCAQAQYKGMAPLKHTCYKNYSGSSSGMESCIIVEGFKKSVEMHNLIYGRIISDGDSSTYSKLLEARPYEGITIEKIECRNHLLRNLCKKLNSLSIDTNYLKKFRNFVTKKRILTIRKVVITAIKKHKETNDVTSLHKDILLATDHAFGMHKTCKPYFCRSIGEDENINKDILTNSIWQKINNIVAQLAAHSRSLVCDVDSNAVENYHSIVAKFVGGKRVNYSQSYQYQMRCNAAALSYNTKKPLYRLHKAVVGVSPRGQLKNLEEGRISRANKYKKQIKRRQLFGNKVDSENYGDSCLRPDVSDEALKLMKESFLKNLKKTPEEREKIMSQTILQSESSEWLELRRNLLTASNFGRIIKRRMTISCATLVKDLLYKQSIQHVASIKHGKSNEINAIRQIEKDFNAKIQPCGLFLDENIPYLGATPDGIIVIDNENMIVEVKCPLTVSKYGLEAALRTNKMQFYKINKNGELLINKNHNWYYQVQGQLHVTKINKCLFAIWSREGESIKYEIIEKDDKLWNEKMEEKLCLFYLNCILPELVDPRFTRNMPIRDPEYISRGIEERKKNNEKKIIQKVKKTQNREMENSQDVETYLPMETDDDTFLLIVSNSES